MARLKVPQLLFQILGLLPGQPWKRHVCRITVNAMATDTTTTFCVTGDHISWGIRQYRWQEYQKANGQRMRDLQQVSPVYIRLGELRQGAMTDSLPWW
jgi:hypothetical protein